MASDGNQISWNDRIFSGPMVEDCKSSGPASLAFRTPHFAFALSMWPLTVREDIRRMIAMSANVLFWAAKDKHCRSLQIRWMPASKSMGPSLWRAWR